MNTKENGSLLDWLLLYFVMISSLVIISCSVASSHDAWSNGAVVPAWVKRACCGPEDVHHLSPEQVHITPAGWQVDGYKKIIPMGKELPSQDGDYWLFYKTFSDGSQTDPYCFFTPTPGY